MKIYHGSSVLVESPLAGVGRENLDFGKGGVANDQVIDTVEDYENGRITAEQALDQLRYKKPNNQICFRN